MTRGTGPDRIVVQPQNDVYTALAGIATLVAIIALVVVIVSANTLFPPNGLGLF